MLHVEIPTIGTADIAGAVVTVADVAGAIGRPDDVEVANIDAIVSLPHNPVYLRILKTGPSRKQQLT